MQRLSCCSVLCLSCEKPGGLTPRCWGMPGPLEYSGKVGYEGRIGRYCSLALCSSDEKRPKGNPAWFTDCLPTDGASMVNLVSRPWLDDLLILMILFDLLIIFFWEWILDSIWSLMEPIALNLCSQQTVDQLHLFALNLKKSWSSIWKTWRSIWKKDEVQFEITEFQFEKDKTQIEKDKVGFEIGT